MIWQTFENRRRTVRRRLGHIGIIMAEPGAAPHYCLVMDESNGGVRINTPTGFDVPSKFILRHSDTEATYKVIWRSGRLVGAERVGGVKHLTRIREREGKRLSA